MKSFNDCLNCKKQEIQINELTSTIELLSKENNKLKKNYNKKIIQDSLNQFPLLPEIKNAWENLASLIFDTFYELLLNLNEMNLKTISIFIQQFFFLQYQFSKNIINKKVMGIMNILNLNINSEKSINLFSTQIKFLFKIYFKNCFHWEQKDTINFINYLKKAKLDNLNFLTFVIKNDSLNEMLSVSYEICLFMLLNDEILTFEPITDNNYILKYEKNKTLNIDGFSAQGNNCILLLNSPMLKKKYQFYKLLPIVYPFTDNENINKENKSLNNNNITINLNINKSPSQNKNRSTYNYKNIYPKKNLKKPNIDEKEFIYTEENKWGDICKKFNLQNKNNKNKIRLLSPLGSKIGNNTTNIIRNNSQNSNHIFQSNSQLNIKNQKTMRGINKIKNQHIVLSVNNSIKKIRYKKKKTKNLFHMCNIIINNNNNHSYKNLKYNSSSININNNSNNNNFNFGMVLTDNCSQIKDKLIENKKFSNFKKK